MREQDHAKLLELTAEFERLLALTRSNSPPNSPATSRYEGHCKLRIQFLCGTNPDDVDKVG